MRAKQRKLTLRDALDRFSSERIDVTQSYLDLLGSAVRTFERINGEILLKQLDASHVRAVMKDFIDRGRTARTANNARRCLLTLWTSALDYGWPAPPLPRKSQLRKLKEPELLATAWRPEQLSKLRDACRRTRTRRGWGPQHWEALLLTIFDTSLRIGCLIRSKLSQLDRESLLLSVPGDYQKGRAETRQSIKPETCQMLMSLPRARNDNRLFPWPFHHDELQRKFRSEIVDPAGLPNTRRDMFHKIRRTSYTMVAVKFGISAASEHAAHKADLSKYYLDKSFLDRPNPLLALPTPEATAPTPEAFVVGTDAALWQFEERRACYCGRWFSVPSEAAVAILKWFVVERGGPVHWEVLHRVAYDKGRNVKDTKARLEQYIERLRGWIREGLGISADPIIEKAGAYTICLPILK